LISRREREKTVIAEKSAFPARREALGPGCAESPGALPAGEGFGSSQTQIKR